MQTPPDDPMAAAGIEFVEYTAPDTQALERLFVTLGFAAVARHRSKQWCCTAKVTSISS